MNAQHLINLHALEEMRSDYVKPMTREEFVAYWLNCGDDPYDMPALESCIEGIGEGISEFGSECALFGDAGPGSLYRIQRQIERIQGVVRRLNEFGCNITMPQFRIPMLGAHAAYDDRY